MWSQIKPARPRVHCPGLPSTKDCLVLRIARQAKQATQSDSSQLRPLPTLLPYFSMYLFLHLFYSFLLFYILLCTQVLIQIHKYKDSDTAEKTTVLPFYALLLFSNVGLALCCTEIKLYQPQTSQVICFDLRKNSTALFQNKKYLN